MNVIISWCPGQSNKCDPCAPLQGYPPWKSIGYDGVVDITFFYQISNPSNPGFVSSPFLCGGHDITFGPHSLPDPGYWFNPPFIPPRSTDVYTFYTVATVSIGTGAPADLPSTSFGGPDSASVQAADLAAQWQGYNYAVSHP